VFVFLLSYANEMRCDPCIIRTGNLKVNFRGKSAHYTRVNTVTDSLSHIEFSYFIEGSEKQFARRISPVLIPRVSANGRFDCPLVVTHNKECNVVEMTN